MIIVSNYQLFSRSDFRVPHILASYRSGHYTILCNTQISGPHITYPDELPKYHPRPGLYRNLVWSIAAYCRSEMPLTSRRRTPHLVQYKSFQFLFISRFIDAFISNFSLHCHKNGRSILSTTCYRNQSHDGHRAVNFSHPEW